MAIKMTRKDRIYRMSTVTSEVAKRDEIARQLQQLAFNISGLKGMEPRTASNYLGNYSAEASRLAQAVHDLQVK